MHNDIIYYQDIVDYFNLEAEYDQKNTMNSALSH